MNTRLPRAITSDEIDRYHRDGVIFLPQIFNHEWIDLLSQGMSVNRKRPTDRSRVWDRDSEGRTMFWDSQAWQGIEQYQRFVFDSPAAELAGELMHAAKINFFFDAVFVRSPGTQFSTPWHQDEPYWSVEGYDTCTIWMPLVPVKQESCLAFVPGSHRKNEIFTQYNFGELNPDQKSDVDQVDFTKVANTEFPDIDANREHFGVVSWDMQPGDCLVFNSRIMHGGSGKLDDNNALSVFTTKWLGDDVRINFREAGMDPDHSQIMTEYGLGPGDKPGTELYPHIWSRGSTVQ